jgi:hypothetical protein
MKKSITVTILLFSLMAPARGDVIFPIYSADKFTAAATIQKTFSYEKRIQKSISILPRTSIAVFWPFYQQSMGGPAVPAGAVEIAMESRWYLFTVDLSKFFVGFYGGGAFIFPSYAALSTSIGLKAGYKVPIVKKIRYYFSIEPYSSISTHPVVHSTFYRSDEMVFFPGTILTLGLNIVSQWGKIE